MTAITRSGVLFSILSSTLFSLALASAAQAQCPPSCPVTGGGKDDAQDCFAVMASEAIALNTPFFDPDKIKPAKEHRCFDGDAGCDLDGVVNNSCTFDVDVCLRNLDPSLPTCVPADVTAVEVKTNKKLPGLETLGLAVAALLPATTNVCTTDQTIVVPLKGPNGKGLFKKGKAKVALTATAGGADDKDQVRLTCMPRGWPSHGYDHANRRSPQGLDTGINAGNVATLTEKWTAELGTTVSSTPTVDAKQVYVSAWDGRVYAISRKKGTVKWTFRSGAFSAGGIQSSVTVAPDGRLIVGDAQGNVYALGAKKGNLLWQASVAISDPNASQIWASPTVANGRVFIGRASKSDYPCTLGHLFAFDLDTGAELWNYQTVPDGVCFADTTTECSTNAECAPGGSECGIGFCRFDKNKSCTIDANCTSLFGSSTGPCITAQSCKWDPDTTCTVDADCPSCIEVQGAGITASAAVSADGETVYAATVGCLRQPSVGESDSIMAFDAATGAQLWSYRTHSIEQISEIGPSGNYQDFGFLNGPIIADVPDGLGGERTVIAAGGKDGSLYAVDPADGSLVWERVVAQATDEAGFGLFNGAVAFSNGLFGAALFGHDNYGPGDPHFIIFDGEDGTTAADDSASNIGTSWGDVTIANDLFYMGANSGGVYYVYDAAGTRLHTLTIPTPSYGGAAILDGEIYVPYGALGSSGGIKVFSLPTP
jgi:outer membrane protein assembly factor BamB